LPLRRSRLTRNTKSAPPGGFRSLLQSSLSAPKAISGATPRMRAASRSNRRAARRSTSSCSNFRSRCERPPARAAALVACAQEPAQSCGRGRAHEGAIGSAANGEAVTGLLEEAYHAES
jgi:hypothetical protein